MNVFKHRLARRLGGLFAGLGALVTMLVVTGTSALAMIPEPGGGGGVSQPPPPPPPAAAGMPGWEITLIVVAAALVAAVLAVLVDRARSARRRPATAQAARNVAAQVSEVR